MVELPILTAIIWGAVFCEVRRTTLGRFNVITARLVDPYPSISGGPTRNRTPVKWFGGIYVTTTPLTRSELAVSVGFEPTFSGLTDRRLTS